MPETLFRVRWPDGCVETYYSPSTVVKQFFEVGQPYSVEEFLERGRVALHTASDRVNALYGMHCSRAMAQLEAIETKAKTQPGNGASVWVEAFTN